jgi:hypothetical protein
VLFARRASPSCSAPGTSSSRSSPPTRPVTKSSGSAPSRTRRVNDGTEAGKSRHEPRFRLGSWRASTASTSTSSAAGVCSGARTKASSHSDVFKSAADARARTPASSAGFIKRSNRCTRSGPKGGSQRSMRTASSRVPQRTSASMRCSCGAAHSSCTCSSSRNMLNTRPVRRMRGVGHGRVRVREHAEKRLKCSKRLARQPDKSSACNAPPARAAAASRSASVTRATTPLAGEKSRRVHMLQSVCAARQARLTSAQRSRQSAGSSARILSATASGSGASTAAEPCAAATISAVRAAGVRVLRGGHRLRVASRRHGASVAVVLK